MINRKFLSAIHGLRAKGSKHSREFLLRTLFFAIGFTPIASVSLSTFDLVRLSLSGPFLVVPAILLTGAICFWNANLRREVLNGFISGLIAVTLYDLTRLPFVFTGLWPDFIPKIGKYLLENPDAHWSVGYCWRYIGNGGGMGLAFCLLFPFIFDKSVSRTKGGVIFGAGVYTCLLITLFASPSGTTYLFKPCLLSASVGLMGHLVYGYVLGKLVERYERSCAKPTFREAILKFRFILLRSGHEIVSPVLRHSLVLHPARVLRHFSLGPQPAHHPA